jgi:hypothetical protein
MKEGTCQFCHRQSTLGYNRARQRLLPRYNYKQITVRTSTSYYASYHTASAEGEFTTQPNEAEQRGGEGLLACCCVPDQRKGVHYLGTIETARGTRATRPPFFSSALASLPLPAPPAPTGTAGRSAAVALVRRPFPRRLSLSVWCTVCTLYVGWAIGLVRRSRWTPMPTPSRPGPGPPKSRNQKRASLSFTVHTTESERGSRTEQDGEWSEPWSSTTYTAGGQLAKQIMARPSVRTRDRWLLLTC